MAQNTDFSNFGLLRRLFEEGDLPHSYLCLLHLTGKLSLEWRDSLVEIVPFVS